MLTGTCARCRRGKQDCQSYFRELPSSYGFHTQVCCKTLTLELEAVFKLVVLGSPAELSKMACHDNPVMCASQPQDASDGQVSKFIKTCKVLILAKRIAAFGSCSLPQHYSACSAEQTIQLVFDQQSAPLHHCQLLHCNHAAWKPTWLITESCTDILRAFVIAPAMQSTIFKHMDL